MLDTYAYGHWAVRILSRATRASVYNGHIRGPMTPIAVELSLPVFTT